MSHLRVRGLRVAFSAVPALDVPSLEIRQGARVAITGPSGCGKTTLAFALSGIQPVQQGEVRWADQEITALPEGARDRWRRRHVGMIFQDFHLIRGMPVLQNVMAAGYFSAWRPVPAAKERALALLDLCGVSGAREDVATLSRGEQQRVAIARALFQDPPILIADEPTASLDAASASAVIGLLREETSRRGTTLLAVSHDPALVEAMDRPIRMAGGRLLT
ncbi:ATP-binding cassette domain-containing protein [Geminicoccus roseus]|uniref:ATP-binding cassette domain-containing protein n=1 Tax=Geminicoccus roseus TaxID=404900 RepID=UPI00041DC840|nr:ATP-binding cassette domain-containing protein [Geminicoccus roseus]